MEKNPISWLRKILRRILLAAYDYYLIHFNENLELCKTTHPNEISIEAIRAAEAYRVKANKWYNCAIFFAGILFRLSEKSMQTTVRLGMRKAYLAKFTPAKVDPLIADAASTDLRQILVLDTKKDVEHLEGILSSLDYLNQCFHGRNPSTNV